MVPLLSSLPSPAELCRKRGRRRATVLYTVVDSLHALNPSEQFSQTFIVVLLFSAKPKDRRALAVSRGRLPQGCNVWHHCGHVGHLMASCASLLSSEWKRRPQFIERIGSLQFHRDGKLDFMAPLRALVGLPRCYVRLVRVSLAEKAAVPAAEDSKQSESGCAEVSHSAFRRSGRPCDLNIHDMYL